MMIISSNILLYSQGQKYRGPDDPAGDKSQRRVGWMSGNRIYQYFKNTTEIGNWTSTGSPANLKWSRWPNNEEGVPLNDGIGLIIATREFIEKDSIPVSDQNQIKTRTDLDTIYLIESNYRDWNAHCPHSDPTGTINWGFEPVPGYFNDLNDYVAMSNIPTSWPLKGWPSTGDLTKWPGEWNGRFGRGVFNAEQESFFVVNDAQDQSNINTTRKTRYYSRPKIKIGDKGKEYITTQLGQPWGGAGLRVEVRGFQWNNPQSKDALFWEYNISNISDYDIREACFGYWVDNGLGGDADDDLAFFNKDLSMAYTWDLNGIGLFGLKTPVFGFAYLESPGIPYDGIDNDNDGLTDEKRDNIAAKIIGPKDGITNLDNYLKHYQKTESDLKPHWDADEDQDWQDGVDENKNGKYDINEFSGDDVGLDGVGPLDLNYTGPDADGTECNHKPDYVEGIGCEPNFASLDIDESDQLGLTSFLLTPLSGLTILLREGSKSVFDLFARQSLASYVGEISNLGEFFASGVFPLYKGLTERISMAMLYSYDPLETVSAGPDHKASQLFKNKEIVQGIYETDYRFVKPPLTPTLSATESDGKIILSWNDISDTKTHESFLKNVNDFEGYKLYRSTDKYFQDCELITDTYGNPVFKKPLYECDLVDGIKGNARYGEINGAEYYLGSDNGIRHYYIDNSVRNGQTYYYGLAAYDYGIPDIGDGITPSENNLLLELDEYDNIRNLGINVKVVTPHQLATGYVSPNITLLGDSKNNIHGTNISIDVNDIKAVKKDHTYKINFMKTPVLSFMDGYSNLHKNDMIYVTSGYSVTDLTTKDTIVYNENPKRYFGDNFFESDVLYIDEQFVKLKSKYCSMNQKSVKSDIIDGIQISITQPKIVADYDTVNSGWFTGKASIEMKATKSESKYFPWDYEMIFTGGDSSFKTKTNVTSLITGENGNGLTAGEMLLDQTFDYYIINKSFKQADGSYEKLDMIIHDVNGNKIYEPDSDYVIAGHCVKTSSTKYRWSGTIFAFRFPKWNDASQRPKKNDIYKMAFKRPLMENDSIIFKVNPAKETVSALIDNGMNNIKVVPNPYVATNIMEQSSTNTLLNQRRKLMFTHIPASSIIKIFTMSGVFINQIDIENLPDNGIIHWDMLTKERLEISAGIYVYHVKSKITGAEKIGKFAVIK
jgi:hypothetical protein